MHALSKYTARHCEPDTERLAAQIDAVYTHVLIVPAYDEPIPRITAMAELCAANKALLILVLNAPNDAPVDCRARTRALLTLARHPNTLCVDRVTIPLNPRAGVGLARKIGSDIAVTLVSTGKITDPWLYQTDADATLPENYFQQPMPDRGTVIFAHRHHADDPALAAAAQLYDQHLAYYVAGLTYAGSPYAYPSMGSTLAIHATSYAAVRGFPQRNAGEDFHILNKLAKVGPIQRVDQVCIDVEARLSHRVPFGTGPSLARIVAAANTDSNIPYLSYHPAVFETLKSALTALEQYAIHPDSSLLPDHIAADLNALGFAKFASTLANPDRSSSQRHKAMHDWFDGLRTLRFVHLTQRRYPDQPLLETLQAPPWQSGPGRIQCATQYSV